MKSYSKKNVRKTDVTSDVKRVTNTIWRLAAPGAWRSVTVLENVPGREEGWTTPATDCPGASACNSSQSE